MAEFASNPLQVVQPNQQVLLNTTIGCPKGYVIHREGSGIVTLRGIVNNPCNRTARYQVTFNGNISVPTGGTVGEISLAVAISGEPDGASLGAYTPTVVDSYGNVTCTTQIDVVSGCCTNISIENTSSTNEAINVRNANLVVSRIG